MHRLRATGTWMAKIQAGLLRAVACHRRNRKVVLLAILGAYLLAVCSACGGGSSSSSSSGTLAITISPQSLTLPVSGAQQFSATVSNSSNTNVTWQVNGTTGGSATYGTISTSGLYTAPSSVPSGTITVTAVAQADTSKTASTTVSVTNANTLVVSPAQATVLAGGQQTFKATLGDQAVDAAWSLSCSSPAGACGTISPSGVYTAPLSPPPGQLVTITANSKNNSANPANGNVVVAFGSGTLIGKYSFTLKGLDGGGQPFSSAGSINFDGKGGITGGIEDRYRTATPVTITGGQYSYNGQGRITATIHTDSGDETWQITLVDHSRALVMRTDSVIAQGDMDLQDTWQFGRNLNGSLSFHVAGPASSAVAHSAVVGALGIDQQGNITTGVLDSNYGGTVSTSVSVAGSSTTSDSASGRGTLSLATTSGTQTFAYYLTSYTSANLIETDGAHNLVGKLAWRTTPVDARNFAGNYAFVFSGANKDGGVGQGGTFTIETNGAVNNGTVANGTFDIGSDVALSLGSLFSGSLLVTDRVSGRSVLTFNVGTSTFQYVVYPPSLNGEMALLEIDNEYATSGLAVQLGAISGNDIPSVSGQFALLAGETSGVVRRTVRGSVGIASEPTGTLDIYDNGNLTLGSVLQGSSFSVTSLYGRGRLQLQTDSYGAKCTTYIVDSNTVLFMETDGKAVLTGVMQKQY